MIASVLAEGRAHRRRLDLSLQLGNQLVMPLRLAVHGVLEPLHEVLKVRDAGLQGVDSVRAFIRPGRSDGPLSGGGYATNLPDPRDQSLALSQGHRFSVGLDRAGRGG